MTERRTNWLSRNSSVSQTTTAFLLGICTSIIIEVQLMNWFSAADITNYLQECWAKTPAFNLFLLICVVVNNIFLFAAARAGDEFAAAGRQLESAYKDLVKTLEERIKLLELHIRLL